MRRQVASLLIPLLLLTAVAAARAAAPSRAEVLELIRGGDSPAALAACRAYLGEHPFDRVMIYNLACLEARGGLAGAALASLERAAAARFDDLAQLETDPDLAPLRGEPRFAALVTEIRTRLVLAAAERGVRLAPGRPAEVTLHPDGPSPLSALPRISLEWRPEGLVVSGIDGGPWPGDAQSSPRLLLTLGPRDRDEPYLARGAFVFAFGAGPKGSGWGAVRVPALDRWQPVAELAPRFGQGGRPWTVTVPWSLVQPFHPLTDPAFGLNAALTLSPVAGEPGPWDAVALLADPRTWDPDAPERRVARLDFDASAWNRSALLGRLADSIVHGDMLDFELTIVFVAFGQIHM